MSVIGVIVMRVGVIGLGRMGSAIAEKFLEKGLSVVGWNRTVEKAYAIKGLSIAGSPREVAESSDIVFIVVSDDQASEAVLLGEEGVFKCSGAPVILNVTTVTPTHSQKMFSIAREKGFVYYEAPVLGGPNAIREGKLVVLLAGEKQYISEVSSVLEGFSSSIHYFGDVPKAMAAKLAFNSLFFTVLESLGETVELASKWGVEPEVIRRVAMDTWTKAIFDKYFERGMKKDHPVGFTVKLAAKDLVYALHAGERKNAFTPAIAASLQSFIQAVNKGYGGRDYASIIRFLLE